MSPATIDCVLGPRSQVPSLGARCSSPRGGGGKRSEEEIFGYKKVGILLKK